MDDAETRRAQSVFEPVDGSEAIAAAIGGGGMAAMGGSTRISPYRFQYRVLKALVLRDLTTRNAQSRLGFAVSVALPIVTLIAMMLMFKLRGRMVPADFSLYVFVATGYPLWQCFLGMYNRVLNSASRSDPLLMFPQITQLDLIVSGVIVEFALNTMVFLILCTGVVVFTGAAMPADPAGVMLCYWSCGWIGLALGMVMCSVQRIAPLVVTFTNTFLRFGMWVSGVVFMVNRLPSWSWPYLKWNPILHAVEGARTLWNPTYHSAIFDPIMIFGIGFVMTICGMVLERGSRRLVGP